MENEQRRCIYCDNIPRKNQRLCSKCYKKYILVKKLKVMLDAVKKSEAQE